MSEWSEPIRRVLGSVKGITGGKFQTVTKIRFLKSVPWEMRTIVFKERG